MTITVYTSGVTYYDCLDPHATEFPREVGLPDPEFTRVGKGVRLTYRLTREQADDMLWHLRLMASVRLMGGEDTPTYVGRAIERDAERLAQTLSGKVTSS